MERILAILITAIIVAAVASADFPGSPIGGGSGSGTTATAVQDNLIVNADINSSAAIDATKIADGTVTSAEFQYLGDVTSAIQAQFTVKAPLASPTFTGTVTVAAPNGIGSDNVSLTGGTIDGIVIGGSTAANGTFLALVADNVSVAQGTTGAKMTLKEASAGGTEYRAIKSPDALSDNNTYLLPTAEPTAAQTWLFSAPSAGVSTITFGTPWIGGSASTLAFATTGSLTGGIMVLDNVTGPTAAQMYGSLNLVNEAITVLLPTAVAGMSGCVMDSGTAHDIIVDVQAGDNVVLVGVTQAGGVGITNASGSSTGDYVCLVAAQANKWYVMGKQGTWASQ